MSAIVTRRLAARTCGALAAAAIALAAVGGGCVPAAPVPTGSPASGESTAAPAAAAPMPSAGTVAPPASGAYLGVYTPPAPFEPAGIDAFEQRGGKSVALVMWYQPWAETNRSRVDTAAIVAVWRRGKVPLITWEPWDPGDNANTLKDPSRQPAYRLAAIGTGAYDAHIREWARGLRDLGGPVMLRPMHEMNGDWYPWSGTANGNKPPEFVRAWRRIHDIFREERATNVTWVWSINHESVPDTKANSYAAYYPGDDYVDWTAISGFNWGTTSRYSVWQGFAHWYAKPLAYLHTLPKPICIAEFATVEQGGSKAAWLKDAYARIGADSRIRAVVYFDSLEAGGSSTQDWRANTSPASLRAFAAAVAPSRFVGTTPPELTAWVDALTRPQWRALTEAPPLY